MGDYESNDLEGAAHLAADAGYDDDRPTRAEAELDDYEAWDDEPDCSFCGGDAVQECDDPIQCCDPGCDGEIGPCQACNGTGLAKHQVVW